MIKSYLILNTFFVKTVLKYAYKYNIIRGAVKQMKTWF